MISVIWTEYKDRQMYTQHYVKLMLHLSARDSTMLSAGWNKQLSQMIVGVYLYINTCIILIVSMNLTIY